jgi:hypothetical protein
MCPIYGCRSRVFPVGKHGSLNYNFGFVYEFDFCDDATVWIGLPELLNTF